ncbi:MAG: OsmC family protein [Promethearchaeota archaeon]
MVYITESQAKVRINLDREMIFKCNLGDVKMEECIIDETNKNEADMLGPNASRLLAMAVLGCLNASFMFCLSKRDFTIEDLESEAVVTIFRNDKGFVRVKKIDVDIKPKINSPEMRKRADQCRKMFEQYCTVTASIREGININVNIDY